MDRLTTTGEALEALEVNQPVRRVLCAVGPGDAGVLKMAADLSKRWSAQLFVVHVVPEIHEGVLASGLIQEEPLSEAKALDFLERLKLSAGGEGGPVQAESIVRTGKARKTIEREAKLLNADVLITGRTPSVQRKGREKKPLIRWDWVLSVLGFDPVSAGW